MRLACFTISSANYIPRAQVLLKSLARHCPDADRFFVLAEEPSVAQEVAEHVAAEVMVIDELDLPRPRNMAFQYNITEYNTALKPFAINALFDKGYDAVIYFDPDICLYDSMDEMCGHLERHELVLTPHITKPLEDDGLFPSVQQCLHAGQFNLGFIELRASDQTRAFVDWWCCRLADTCIMEPNYWYFVDQFWAAQAISYVDNAKVVRSSRYNMAYWNLFQRELTRDGGRWTTEHGPLVFFHYSGYMFDTPNVLSRFTTRYNNAEDYPLLAELLREYRELTDVEKRLCPTGLPEYSYARYHDGREISQEARRRFLNMSDDEKAALGDPFGRSDALEKTE